MGDSGSKSKEGKESTEESQEGSKDQMTENKNGRSQNKEEGTKERRGVPPNYSKYKPVSMKLNLFRNADTSFYPVPWIYSSLKCKTFDRVMEEVEERVPERTTRWGHAGAGVKRIYTSDGRKIESLQDLHAVDDSIIVCGGKEPFENVGYASFLEDKPPEDKKDEPEMTYREKNKKRYGDQKRSEEEKIHNRTDIGTNKKFTVYRNGDEEFKPKLYVWRSKQTPNFEKLCEDLTRIAPPQHGGPVTCLYSTDGKVMITELQHIQDKGHYVAAAGPFERLHGGYEPVEFKEATKRSDEGKGRGEGKAGGRGRPVRSNRPAKAKSNRGGGGGSDDEFEDSVWNDEDLLEKDREMLARHYEKNKDEKRRRDEKINEREDQIRPTNFLIYVFRNGAGQSSTAVHFTGAQLDRGMNWIQEQCAKKHKVNPKKLTTLSGVKIEDVSDLINRGAYVIVALGERFRDVWYFLPAEALDTTSNEANDENSKLERSKRQEREGSSNRDGRSAGYEKYERNTRSADGKSRQSDYQSIITELETRVSNLEREKKTGNSSRGTTKGSVSRRRSADSKRSDVQIMVVEEKMLLELHPFVKCHDCCKFVSSVLIISRDKDKGRRSSSFNRQGRSVSSTKPRSKYDSLSVNNSEPGSSASGSSTNKRPSTGRPPMRNY